MRLKARLNVMEGRVVCPRSCERRPVSDCVSCSAMQRIESEGYVVLCEPEVNRPLSEVLEDMIRV